MSKIPERSLPFRRTLKAMGNQNKFLTRITKTLYYGKLPKTDRLSLPMTELASELFSSAHKGRSLKRLYCEEASEITRNACVSPCSFVLALLYLERLKNCNPDYLQQVAPSKLFLISLLVSSKFLQDDGAEDEVFASEWTKSGEVSISELCQLEKEFLKAIDWNVFVREPLFWSRLEQLETDLALHEGVQRGWFTYTEIKYFSNVYELQHGILDLLQTVVAVSAVLALTYAVGVATLAGSVFLTSRVPGTYLHQCTHKNNTLDLLASSTAQPNDVSNSTDDLDTIVWDILTESKRHKSLDAINVLKTSFILASISCNTDCDDINTENCDSPEFSSSWDWWNNPIINWLSDISRNTEFEGIKLPHNYYKNFAHDKLVDMSIAQQKKLQLEDEIHKATKVRMQEQLERSWHKEWTDSVFFTLGPYLSQISAY